MEKPCTNSRAEKTRFLLHLVKEDRAIESTDALLVVLAVVAVRLAALGVLFLLLMVLAAVFNPLPPFDSEQVVESMIELGATK